MQRTALRAAADAKPLGGAARVMAEHVDIVPYDPGWPREFELERARIESAGNTPGIFIHIHSVFPDLHGCPNAAGIHVIRDPRDVLISAARYHCRSSEE